MKIQEAIKSALVEKGYNTATERGRALCALGNYSKGNIVLKHGSVKAFLCGTKVADADIGETILSPMQVASICIP